MAKLAIQALEDKKAEDIKVIDISEVSVIADYIEPGRKHAENLPQVRRLAYQDLDDCMRKILGDTLEYLAHKGGRTDTMTQRTYEYYMAGKQH